MNKGIGPSGKWQCEGRGCNKSPAELIEAGSELHDSKWLCSSCWNKWLKKNMPHKYDTLKES